MRNQEALITVLMNGHVVPGKARGLSERLSTRKGQREYAMSYHILFAALCAVIAANVLVAGIAITRAYREEKRSRRFVGFAPR